MVDERTYDENNIAVDINDEVKKSFLDYAMSVIVSRALPDVRDGLKPVQRRIVYAMFEAGMRPGTAFRKCATVVGNVMGSYHPHGNDAIYDALVRLGQDFSSRYPLISPQGNFGTIDDPPAAMRYTESRLSSIAMHLLEGIREDTVDFQDNYSGESSEPIVLPARYPNLLANGILSMLSPITNDIDVTRETLYLAVEPYALNISSGQPAQFTVTVQNQGFVPVKIRIGGLSTPTRWMQPEEKVFNLSSHEVKSYTVTITPPEGMPPGTYYFEITAAPAGEVAGYVAAGGKIIIT